MKKIIFVFFILLSKPLLASELVTCFTPGENCTDLIVKQINQGLIKLNPFSKSKLVNM